MGFKLPFLYIFKLVFINIFVSNVTPLATGGGFVQVYFMTQRGMAVGEASAATSIRTILSALILFAFTPLIIWLEPNEFKAFMNRQVLIAISVASSLIVLLLFLLTFYPDTIKRGSRTFLHFLFTVKILSPSRQETTKARLATEIDGFSQAFKHFFKKGGLWAVSSVLWTFLFLLFLFSFSVVLIQALGYEIPFLSILAVQVVVTFFMYFAPTPGATGIAEGGYGLLFSQLVDHQDIFVLTLAWRFLTIYIGIVLGILIFAFALLGKRKEQHL
jgi:uncharacterized protein (TIRG00374 family)